MLNVFDIIFYLEMADKIINYNPQLIKNSVKEEEEDSYDSNSECDRKLSSIDNEINDIK